MQTTTTLLAAATLALGAFVPNVSAEDYRQLVKHSSESGDKFCDQWRCACVNYKPFSTFDYALCEVGDYQGKHTKTQAKVDCLYKNEKGKVIVYTDVIAKQLNATYITA